LATEPELEASLKAAQECRDWMRTLGLAEAILERE
jgi:hypothetical protein